jgi:ribonuclease HI
MSREFQSTKV